MDDLTQEQLDSLLKTLSVRYDMPWELLIPLIMKLLESLVKKEREAAVKGTDGPVTAYFAAKAAGATDEGCMKAAAEAYVRCCA